MSSYVPILSFGIRSVIQTVRFHAVHTVRWYGARRFFLLIRSIRTIGNACIIDSHRTLWRGACGAVRCGEVRCGFLGGEAHGAVRRGAVRFC